MKIVITGADGQLGAAFQKEFLRRGVPFFGTDVAACDITRPDIVGQMLDAQQPAVLINCAAYNLVDEAEKDPQAAYAVNAGAVEVLARACQDRGIKLVHYSSDYVFDGQKEGLYEEKDPVHPLNVYGASKLQGESLACQLLQDHLVFRTSWVYGQGRQNFLYKVSQWMRQSPVLRIAADEVSVPTSVEDLVQVTCLALDKGMTGLYHLTSSGYASRYEWARYFLQAAGFDVLVVPVPMASFQLKAARPRFSAMSSKKISDALGIRISDWRDGVQQYVRDMIGHRP